MVDVDHIWEAMDEISRSAPLTALQLMLAEREREHFEQRRRDYAEDARRNYGPGSTMAALARDDRLFRGFLDGGSIPLRLELWAMRIRLRCTLPGRYRRAQEWTQTTRAAVHFAVSTVATIATAYAPGVHPLLGIALILSNFAPRVWLLLARRHGDAPDPITP